MKAGAQPTERALTDLVREIALSGDITVPPLPEVAQGLVRILEDKDRADAARVAAVIRRDSAITASLLRTANSAFYGGLQQVSDLSQAIARLGMQRVATLAITMAHKGRFETDDPEREAMFRGLWNHSLAAALAAKRLAGLSGGDTEESYLAGLLHDIGKTLGLRAMDHLMSTNASIEVTPAMTEETLSATHAELGHRILTDWRLPESICRAVALHHDEYTDDTLALRVQAADAIAIKLGAHPHPQTEMVLEENPAIERLNLTDVELAALIIDVEDDYLRLHELL